MRITTLAVVAVVGSLSGFAVSAAPKEEFGTAKEAEAMVNKAVAYIKSAGTEKAYAEFTNKAPAFNDRDLYVVVYDLEGRVLAHGLEPQDGGQGADRPQGPRRQGLRQGAGGAGAQQGHLLARLQVHGSHHQEDRAQVHLLPESWKPPPSAWASTSASEAPPRLPARPREGGPS